MPEVSLTRFVMSLQLFKTEKRHYVAFTILRNPEINTNLHMHEWHYVALTMPSGETDCFIDRNLDTMAKCMDSNYEFQLCNAQTSMTHTLAPAL